MGKTAGVLAALTFLDEFVEPVFPALVIAPLRVASTVWPAEIRQWDICRDVRVATLLGSANERLAALKTDAEIYTINYENIPWLTKTLEAMGKPWPFRTVVADESTKLRNFRTRQGGVRARALSKIVGHTERWINLTGTPTPNGLANLWGQHWFVDQGEALGKTYTQFQHRWFYPGYDGFSWKPHKFAEEQILTAMAPTTCTLKPENFLSLDAPQETVVPVTLPAPAAKIYRDMERDTMVSFTDDTVITAVNAAVRTIKCLQITSGFLYNTVGDNESVQFVHDEKIKALESILNEWGGSNIIVVYNFKHDLQRLLKHFPQAKVLDKNPKTIEAWNAGEIPVLLVHPASAGHGLNLQHGGHVMVFYSLWWDLEQYSQVIERIGPARQKQAGYNRTVHLYYLLAEKTLDETVLERIRTKKTVQELIMQRMSERRKDVDQ